MKMWRAVRSLGRILGVPLAGPNAVLAYEGNEIGGSYFRFSPAAMRQALLASGFARVQIGDFFDLPSANNRSAIPLVVHHCYVA